MKAAITYTDLYIPQRSYRIDDYVKFLDTSVLNNGLSQEEIAGVLKYSMGVEKVYIEDKKNSINIFTSMVEKYLDQSGTKPEEISFIIYSRGNSIVSGDPWSIDDSECINLPYYLQRKFGMVNAQIFNLEQECSGTLMTLRIAMSLIKDNSKCKILHLTSNFFETAEKRLMGGLVVVSDGLALMEISSSDSGLRLIDFEAKTDSRFSKVKDLSDTANVMFVVETGCELIRKILNQNSLQLDDISYIIPQNISRNVWNIYCNVLEYPKEKVFLKNITNGGHMGDVDIVRNITGINKERLLTKGKYILAYGIGTGTSWNCLLMQYA